MEYVELNDIYFNQNTALKLDEKAEEIIEACDNVFYENEEEIKSKLEAYADKIQL